MNQKVWDKQRGSWSNYFMQMLGLAKATIINESQMTAYNWYDEVYTF